MTIAHSRLTAQGQISVPAAVRRKLGIGPGSTLEWQQDGDRIVVRRVGRFSSKELHEAIFAAEPEPKTLADLKAGVGNHIRRHRARR